MVMETEILTESQARAGLKLDADADVSAAIKAAISYIERYVGALVDRDVTFLMDRPLCADDPIVLPFNRVKAVKKMETWATDASLRDDPADIDVSTLGRIENIPWNTEIWPPEGGWPEILENSQFRITLTLGWKTAEEIPGLDGIRAALILQAGVYYDGILEDTHRKAIMALITPFSDPRGFI